MLLAYAPQASMRSEAKSLLAKLRTALSLAAPALSTSRLDHPASLRPTAPGFKQPSDTSPRPQARSPTDPPVPRVADATQRLSFTSLRGDVEVLAAAVYKQFGHRDAGNKARTLLAPATQVDFQHYTTAGVNPSPFSGSPNNPGPPGRPERPTAPEGRSDGWTHRGQLLQHHTTATPSRTESIPIALHLSEWRREKSRPRACRIHSTSAKVIPRLL